MHIYTYTQMHIYTYTHIDIHCLALGSLSFIYTWLMFHSAHCQRGVATFGTAWWGTHNEAFPQLRVHVQISYW